MIHWNKCTLELTNLCSFLLSLAYFIIRSNNILNSGEKIQTDVEVGLIMNTNLCCKFSKTIIIVFSTTTLKRDHLDLTIGT